MILRIAYVKTEDVDPEFIFQIHKLVKGKRLTIAR
jgi:hypothetical protein